MSKKSNATPSKITHSAANPISVEATQKVSSTAERAENKTQPKVSSIGGKLKKADIVNELARRLTKQGVPTSRVQVRGVIDGLSELIEQSLSKEGIGEFNIPGLIKIERYIRRPTNTRPGRNMQTQESMMIPAQPKRAAVRCKPLTKLKRMVEQ